MMRWIVGSSLRFRFVVVALGVALIYLGAHRIADVPVDVFPEFSPTKVEIQTICLGLSPAEVESLVTVPLENALAGVPGIAKLRSKSVSDLSSVVMWFQHGVDEIQARQYVSERISIATPTLPTWAAPPYMMPPLSSTSRVMKIGVTSKDKSVMDLSMLAYWTIRARLLGVPGVANIAIWGEQLKMLQVVVNPEKLQKIGVTLDEVQEEVSDALDVGLLRYSKGAHIGTGGFIDTPNQRMEVLHTSAGQTPETLAQVPIKTRTGIVPLGQVADILYAPPDMIGDAVINDGPGLMLIVEKFPWGNTLDVTRGVEAALDAMKPGLPGVDIDTKIFRPASFIEASIANLKHALLLGCLLVIAILVAFLYDLRAALIAAIAIPLSLLAGGLVLFVSGASVNTMVLAGFVIALGGVVDDAIIDIENIMRRLRQRRAEGSAQSVASVIFHASMEVRTPILYATLIIVVAVVPVFFLEGLSGAFFKPLVMAYVLAMLASMAVAVTITPALSLILLRNAPLKSKGSPLVAWLGAHYSTLLGKVTRTPRASYIAVVAITVIGFASWPLLGHSLLPDFKERDFLMHWVTEPSTSHPEMVRITTRASRELRSISGVRNFGAHIGQAYLADEVYGVYFGENWISIDPAEKYEDAIAAVGEVVDGYPGLYRDLQTYLKERIREVLTGAGEAIVVRIYGPDLQVLRDKAEEVRVSMAAIDGVAALHKELMVEVPQVQVQVNLDAAQRYGLKPGDVRRASAAIVAGNEVGDIFAGGRTYDVHVWTAKESRHSLNALQNMLINTSTGKTVRLSQVADVRIGPTPNSISREGNSRRIDVHCNTKGRDLSSVAEDVQRAIDKVEFPLGYRAVLQGEYAELKAARERMFVYTLVAAVSIFLLLHLSLGNWRVATMSFLTLPFALVGGILAAFAGGGVISLGSLVGFLTVLGIAARNGIMMISHFQHLERHEGEPFGLGLVLRGARERLSPILMTTGATALAIVPLVVYGNLPGHEIEFPMAVVILGVLVTSTLLNLFIVPALYLRFGGGSAHKLESESVAAGPATSG
jgi:CzcA family heavy metal efflux pump